MNEFAESAKSATESQAVGIGHTLLTVGGKGRRRYDRAGDDRRRRAYRRGQEPSRKRGGGAGGGKRQRLFRGAGNDYVDGCFRVSRRLRGGGAGRR